MSYDQLVASVDHLAEKSTELKIAAENNLDASTKARNSAAGFAVDALTSVSATQSEKLQAQAARLGAEQEVAKAAKVAEAVVEEALEALATLDGSSAIGHSDGLVGSIITDLRAIAKESLDVTRFGAKGNYIVNGTGNDDTLSFQKAFDAGSVAGNRTLKVKAGTYLITGTVTGQPMMLIGEPGATRIVFKNMADMVCFKFNSTTQIGRVLGSYGIEYIVEGANVDCVFEGPLNSSQYFTYYLRYMFQFNYFRGANRVPAKYSFGWDYGAKKWLRISDCVGAQIDHNCMQGVFDIITDPLGQLRDAAFELNANGAVLSARIHDNNIGPCHTGVVVKNKAFMTVHDNDIIGTMDGIIWDGEILLNEPKIYNNNLNVQRNGFLVNGPSSLHFTGNTIRRHRSGWKGATHEWAGYHITGGSDIHLVGNSVQPDEGGGVFTGDHYGYRLTNSGLVMMADNFVGVGCDYGITLDNCSASVVTGTVTAQSAASDVLFDLRNNTRSSSIGAFALVSSFAGTTLKKDASIVAAIQMINSQFDLQSTSSVQIDLTRVNAGVDEKRVRMVKGTTSFAIQHVNDAGLGTNAVIFNHTGSAAVSMDVRGVLITGGIKPRSTNASDIGSSTELFKASYVIRRYWSATVFDAFGTGTPEGSIVAGIGSTYRRTDGAVGSTLYYKASGTGNTGWVAVA